VNSLPQQFAEQLLTWYKHHGRHQLPWQNDPTPYRVWVSEVMLQQTQVATVVPYYERFMSRFRDIKSLAQSPLDEVLHLWTGLGYYARARNLHACALAVLENHHGELPATLQALMTLPGIGRSTAGAVLALSSGQRQPILDGNVKRVMARVFGIGGDPSSSAAIAALWAQSEACTPYANVREYTQAIMDLGATLCTRSKPACARCPVSSNCFAALEGRQAEFPGKKTKRIRPSREATLLIAQSGNDASLKVLIERRPSAGIWGGLWSPPQFDSQIAALNWVRQEIGEPECESQHLPSIDHAFTHFDLRLNPVIVRCRAGHAIRDEDDRLWYPLEAPPRIGLPQPIRKLFEHLRAARRA
jgi:A/G-specific adenine glycosylase